MLRGSATHDRVIDKDNDPVLDDGLHRIELAPHLEVPVLLPRRNITDTARNITRRIPSRQSVPRADKQPDQPHRRCNVVFLREFRTPRVRLWFLVLVRRRRLQSGLYCCFLEQIVLLVEGT